MKKTILLLTCLISISSFAATCPSVETLNDTISQKGSLKFGDKINVPGSQSPFRYFNPTVLGKDQAKLDRFYDVVIQTEREDSSIPVGCYYSGVDSNGMPTIPLLFINTGVGPYIGTSGSWKAIDNQMSTCEASDVNGCQFERKAHK